MAQQGGFTWNGDEYSLKLAQAAADGLNRGAEFLRAKSVPRAPVDRGPLRGSAQVHEASPDDLESAVSYDTPYAVRQHEELGYRHDDGEAKYLERPLHENDATIQALIAKAIGRIG